MAVRKTETIRTELQELFNKISDYYYTWKLEINGSKCETILFRPKTSKIGSIEREHCKKFHLKEKANEGDLIPHKNCVKYLGVNIDEKLNYKQHIEIQLSKASKALWKTKKIVLLQTSQQQSKNHVLPNANKTHYNLRLSNMVQHTSFINGKNSHIRKNMHQSLPEHLQIRTQRIQKICEKQKNIRLSQHPPHRLSHPKTNKKPLCARAKIKENSLIFGCLFPTDVYYKNTLLIGYSPPPRSFSIPRRKKLSPRPK